MAGFKSAVICYAPDNMRSTEKTLFCLVVFIFIFGPTFSYSQEKLGVDPTGRSGDESFLLKNDEPVITPPLKILPPLPETKAKELPIKSVFITKIKLTGNTVFSEKELSTVTAAYINRQLTFEDMEELRRLLTLYYINKGYINSGAVIPDQKITGGVITLQINEGELTSINVKGLQRFKTGYIDKRLALGAGRPLNINLLQQKLQLLQQDKRIKRINAELKPGLKLGESILNVRIQENCPYKFQLKFNNYHSPTVGAELGQISIVHQNLTGHGDILELAYEKSEGIDPQIDAAYSYPVTVHDTTVNFRYRKNDFDVIEKPFDSLDIKSESEIYELTLRHPIYRTGSHELSLSFTGEHLHNETFLLKEPFTFSPGAKDGESTVTALRFTQEWTLKTRDQVFAIRSRFSFGIDALDATINSDSNIPDSRFFSWLGQFQWARRLKFMNIRIIWKADLQLTKDPLLPLEQIAVGGRFSVRGYRENQMVRDKAGQ